MEGDRAWQLTSSPFSRCTLSKKGGFNLSLKSEPHACDGEGDAKICLSKEIVGKYQGVCIVTVYKMSKEHEGTTD